MNTYSVKIKKVFRDGNKYEIAFAFISILTVLILSIFCMDSSSSLAIGIFSIIASLTGIIATLLIAKKSGWNYPGGVIQIVLYGVISLITNLYGDAVLNFLFFLPMCMYGMFYGKKNESSTNIVSSHKLSTNEIILMSFITLAMTILVGLLLEFATNDPYPWLDSASTVLSILGMYLMMKAYREQYGIGTVINVVSTIMGFAVFATGQSYALPLALMYVVFTLIGTGGLFNGYKKPKYIGNRPLKGTTTGSKAIYK